MPDTPALLTFTEYLVESADQAGWGRDSDKWDDDETARLGRAINLAYQQLLFPPILPGETTAHRWTFLQPVTTLETVNGTWEYDLPAIFGTLIGDLTYATDDGVPHAIKLTNEERIRKLRSDNDADGRPNYGAVRPADTTMAAQQTMELLLYPTPNDAYTLSYAFDVLVVDLSDANPYPLGGQPHNLTLLQSCRDLVDVLINDGVSNGREHARFLERLAASVEYDRRNAPAALGYNGDGERRIVVRHGTDFSCSIATPLPL